MKNINEIKYVLEIIFLFVLRKRDHFPLGFLNYCCCHGTPYTPVLYSVSLEILGFLATGLPEEKCTKSENNRIAK